MSFILTSVYRKTNSETASIRYSFGKSIIRIFDIVLVHCSYMLLELDDSGVRGKSRLFLENCHKSNFRYFRTKKHFKFNAEALRYYVKEKIIRLS